MRLRSWLPTSGMVLAGRVIVVGFALVAIVGPMVAQYGPRASGPEVLAPPSAAHWFGTTQTGQDVFAQFVYGARVALAVGVFGGVVSQVVAIVVGVIGGYFRGLVDDWLYILISVFLVFPGMPMLIVLN